MIFLVTNSWHGHNPSKEFEFNSMCAEGTSVIFLYDKSKHDGGISNWLERFNEEYSQTDFSKTNLSIYVSSVEQFKYFKENFETFSVLIYYSDSGFEEDCRPDLKSIVNDFDCKYLVQDTRLFYIHEFKKLTLQN